LSCWRGPSLRRPAPRVLLQSFVQDVPLSIEHRSQAARGFALQRRARTAPVRSQPAVLNRSMSVSDAFKAVMWANLSHLQANARGLLAGRDPEYLHQMRVALRRLRSAFNVFAPLLPKAAMAPWVAELRWLASRFGPARDWDVFMTETLPAIEALPGTRGALRTFSTRYGRLRGAANARARCAVRSARYQRLMLALAGWLAAGAWLARLDHGKRAALESPVEKFAAAVLEKRHTRVRKRGRGLDGLSAPDLHRLRIAVKKFRYATDFFTGLFSAHRSRTMRGRLVRLQDILGAMNDAATGARLVALGIGRVPGGSARRARSVALGWVRNRDAALKRELQSAWKALRSAEKFW
jgi:triphosphatase